MLNIQVGSVQNSLILNNFFECVLAFEKKRFVKAVGPGNVGSNL